MLQLFSFSLSISKTNLKNARFCFLFVLLYRRTIVVSTIRYPNKLDTMMQAVAEKLVSVIGHWFPLPLQRQEERVRHHHQQRTIVSYDDNDMFVNCPFNDCSVPLLKNRFEIVIRTECPVCHRLFCAQCNVPWHSGLTCQQFQPKCSLHQIFDPRKNYASNKRKSPFGDEENLTPVSISTNSSCPTRKNARLTNNSPNPPLGQRNFPFPYMDQLPLFMHQFIEDIVDVAGDGHCGFRAVSGLLGRSVETHSIIRLELLQELNSNRQSYLQLFGSERRFKQIKHALTPAGIGLALEDKWMTFPDMGFLIAQKYKCVVLLLTRYGMSETFFPLRCAPTESDRLMCLGYVNNNHFMQVNFYLFF